MSVEIQTVCAMFGDGLNHQSPEEEFINASILVTKQGQVQESAIFNFLCLRKKKKTTRKKQGK